MLNTTPRAAATRTLISGAIVGFAAAPLVFLTACATADGGKADPAAGLLNTAETQPGLNAGDRAPSGTLRDPNAASVRLADLYAEQPAVLVFYRGGWCPFCNRDLMNWETALPQFEAAGARVVAVSMETAEHALTTASDNKLSYDVFVDETGELVRAFRLGFELDAATQSKYKGYGIDLASQNASGEWVLPAPAVYVIGTDGVIRYASAEWDYRERDGYEDALAVVRGLN